MPLMIAVGVVAFFIGYMVVQNFVPSNVDAPTLSASYTDPQSTFTIKQPQGWDVHSAEDVKGDPGSTGESETTGVLFSKGTASIDITVEDRSKAMASQLLTGSGTGADAFSNPTSTLDHFDKHCLAVVSGGYRNYTEKDEGYFTVDGWGEGHGYVFTADGPRFGLPAHVKGYRVCLLGASRTALIKCECRDSNYDTLKQSFQDMINSMQERAMPGGNAPGMAIPH